MTVHVLDFTGAGVRGADLRLELGTLRSHAFAVSENLYAKLNTDALRVFRLLRSGTAIPDDVLAGYRRPAGHAGRAPNRGDTDVAAWTGPDAEWLYPGWRCEGTFDVSGGWYDAGDYGKYVSSGSIAVWQLLSTLDVIAAEPARANTLASAVRDECRWQLDWLMRMQVPSGDPLADLAFHRVHGTEWSPLPGWAHEDPTPRVLHRPSTTASLHLAAVGGPWRSLLRRPDSPTLERLMTAARVAYAAAQRHPFLGRRTIMPVSVVARTPTRIPATTTTGRLPSCGSPRASENLRGRSAGVRPTCTLTFSTRAASTSTGWPHRLGSISHCTVPACPTTTAFERASSKRRTGSYGYRAAALGTAVRAEAGWDWGSNGRILNNLVVLVVAGLLTDDDAYRDAVVTGMDYLLGRNALGQSYVTGHGTEYTRHQRTRQFGHDLAPAFPPPPPGALAGGPNSRPHPDFPYDARLDGLPPQCCYLDEPTSEVTNDICIRWNAPLVYVSSFLRRSR